MMRATQYEWENKIDGNQTTNQILLRFCVFSIKMLEALKHHVFLLTR